ncbi:putative 3-oxoacyl-[acyl-carrier-protein] reductase [Kyrpidia spormannii]|uniref:Putative 3-oxoacyl-[acyl-carrier-protein] reductase n=1 Tax=Kyrpidia spormannii TaxID=2055160 RepID=A0A6F9EEE4_9BACL|nr:putative 3-oxoacyl-[acyl-carrier-protein] reductase [Kyrpidia spormannii]
MFDGKAAIVTGAGRGIGRAIAMALAARAARVMVNDIEEAAVERVVAEIRDLGGAAVGMVADVTREEEVDKLVSACVSKFDTVDILVNNAGIVQTGPLTSITAADWDRVMAVNLKGVFLCCRAVFPIMMQKGGGKIVNVASVAGKRGAFGKLLLCRLQRGGDRLHEVRCPGRGALWHQRQCCRPGSDGHGYDSGHGCKPEGRDPGDGSPGAGRAPGGRGEGGVFSGLQRVGLPHRGDHGRGRRADDGLAGRRFWR